jgi:hypothetical protein
MKTQGHWLNALGLALNQNLVSEGPWLELAPSAPRVPAPRTCGLSEK